MQLLTPGGKHFEHRMPAPPGSLWGDPGVPVTNGQLGQPVAGINVNEAAARGVPAVRACGSILSDAVATLPLRQYKGSSLRMANAKEVAPSPLIENPWPDAGMNLVDFVAGGQWSLALRGNFYGQIVDRDKTGIATMIRPFDTDQIQVKRLADGGVEYKHGRTVIPADDVFHIRNIARPGALCGLSPLEDLRLTFGLARVQDIYASTFFSNSAVPNGIIESAEELSEDQTLALARAWTSAHQGLNQANLPAVLTGGLHWVETQIKPEDMQFIESRQLSVTEIAMAFRIPPHMISAVDRTTSWGTGIEQQEMGFVRITLAGYLRRWEVALSALLPAGQFVKFDLKERLRGDSLQRAQLYTLGVNGGWMNPDTVLAAEDEPPLPDGKGTGYRMPLNFAVVGPDGVPQPMPAPAPTGTSGVGVPTANPMSPDTGAEKSPSSGV